MSDISEQWSNTTGIRLTNRPFHRLWLVEQSRALFDFYLPAALNPAGGFFNLSSSGTPLPGSALNGQVRALHQSTRMVHCAAIGSQLGLPGVDRAVDHGMAFIWDRHRDGKHGGYFWGVDDVEVRDPLKQAYGHAFVLLAASSAKVVGHPDADKLLFDVAEVLEQRFWDADIGATTEEYESDWSSFSQYRGQNSNMHLTEALMAAFEATQDNLFLEKAQSIAELIINTHARAEGWRVPEHFDVNWNVDRNFVGDPMFRPRGLTPGHAMEWSRLLVQLWELGGRHHDWMVPAAEALFLAACDYGWDRQTGGFYYSVLWDNSPDQTDRYWWPCCEGIAAASVLSRVSDNLVFEHWYRRIWTFVRNHFIDDDHGGWYPELDEALQPVERVFAGKPDVYHAVQACLIPLLPTHGSITRHLGSAAGQSLLTGG
jgi:sulfoquinovose isomerase